MKNARGIVLPGRIRVCRRGEFISPAYYASMGLAAPAAVGGFADLAASGIP